MASRGSIKAARAFVELFADDSRLLRGLRRAEKKLKAFGAKLKALGQELATKAAILQVLAMTVFAGFDDHMRAVRAVVGTTGEQFQKLNDKAKLLARTTSFTAAEVASAMLELGRAGFATDEVDAAGWHGSREAKAKRGHAWIRPRRGPVTRSERSAGAHRIAPRALNMPTQAWACHPAGGQVGGCSLRRGRHRFLSVTPRPSASMCRKTVSKSGFVVIASM